MRVVAGSLLLPLAGCSSIFGLDSPVLLETTPDAGPPADGQLADVPPDVADAQPPGDACPASYSLTSGMSHYRMIATNLTWLAAAQDCADDMAIGTKHTHLVVVASDAERTQLAAMGVVVGWVGLTDIKTEGTYRWVTGEPTTYPPPNGTPWAQGEPDNALGQDCVAASLAAQWQDANCGATTTSLCECDDYANDPTSYGP